MSVCGAGDVNKDLNREEVVRWSSEKCFTVYIEKQ